MAEQARIAAAVGYRKRNGNLEFVLVRTKDGDKWTFPKGHVEPGETPADAALREAQEEAGVTGTIDRTPFAEYSYPATRSGEGEARISAYLLNVTHETRIDAHERFRRPTWFGYEAARDRLAEGDREARFVSGHDRVLRAALAELDVLTTEV